ncbi:MAG: acetylxylan esterase [Bacteroidales bacterium]|nr:acetylxylan esterase [Bacteroidales bacterium]
MHYFPKLVLTLLLSVFVSFTGSAQKKSAKVDVAEALKGYFTPVTTPSATPDAEGFIRRWMILEPISKPNSTNRVFTDSYTRENLSVEYFPNQLTVIPRDGDKVKVTMEYQPPVDLTARRPVGGGQNEPKFVKATLTWHALDSDHFFVKLFRFATGLDKDRYGVIFWTVTVINCDEDIENVRLSIGSNKAARWWVNGEELLLLAGDRHMGVDSAVSDRITLKKGRNILRGVTMNGPGMSEFCARFIDDHGNPVTNYTITCN